MRLFQNAGPGWVTLVLCGLLAGCVPADDGADAPNGEPASVNEAAPDRLPSEAESDGSTKKQAQLLLELPAGCNTPDGMTLLDGGDVILSMPNFNQLDAGARLMRISADNRASVFMELPAHPGTGNPVGPLGICVAPGGDLLLADYQMEGDRQSRVLRISMKEGKPTGLKPVITGFHVSNAVICRGDSLYVSETQIDTSKSPATSGIMRFALSELDGEPVVLAEDETQDPHLLGIINVNNQELQLGADGLCFDQDGNLYCGNFADGTVHRFEFDADGKVTANTIFARSDFMKSADGLFFDPDKRVIYVADSKANAIQRVHLDGKVDTLVQNGDTDGTDGGMDQPCEVILRGRKLIVSNMDWPVPGCINPVYDPFCSLSVFDIE